MPPFLKERLGLRGPWEWALLGFFLVALYPLTVAGESLNYSFALLPVLAAVVHGRLARPSAVILVVIGFFTSIFVLAVVTQPEFIGQWPRRILSFFAFLAVFALLFVRLDGMVRVFKVALVVASVAASFFSIALFLQAGNVDFEAKDLVGSQRYGFIYLLGIWVLILAARPKTASVRILRAAATVVILLGLLLTFSRDSVLSLAVSSGVFFLWVVHRGVRSPWAPGRVARRLVVAAVAVLVVAGLINAFFPVVPRFFDARLLQMVWTGQALENLVIAETSEGSRFVIWQSILDYVFQRPLTGSGYLGAYVLGDFTGSAHSQFFDFLLRTGLMGFAIFLYLLWRIGAFLRATHADLFFGFIGVLTYGLFHETFKESQGGFVLAFLLAIAFQWRAHASARAPRPFARATPEAPA